MVLALCGCGLVGPIYLCVHALINKIKKGDASASPFLFTLNIDYREWPIKPKEAAIISAANKVMDKPILTVSAFTVRSLPLLSLTRKNKAENKLLMMTINTTTVAILIHMVMSNCFVLKIMRLAY
jgi:hypothetical protein